jgi:NAD(P)-dependent dehydrogenase (short-subunit alcohol dehydrogenase family)
MELGLEPLAAMRADWDRVLAVNLTGAFNITAMMAELFVRQRHGHLIHLCSNASRVSLYGSHAYVASKHGLEGLIRSAAAQLARHGVRVNGLAPGTVETDLNRDLLRGPDGRPSLRAASILAHTPTKRFATVEGIVESAIALCLPQRHLTGNVIFCDDGYNVEGHSWPEGTRDVYDAIAGTGRVPAVDEPEEP